MRGGPRAARRTIRRAASPLGAVGPRQGGGGELATLTRGFGVIALLAFMAGGWFRLAAELHVPFFRMLGMLSLVGIGLLGSRLAATSQVRAGIAAVEEALRQLGSGWQVWRETGCEERGAGPVWWVKGAGVTAVVVAADIANYGRSSMRRLRRIVAKVVQLAEEGLPGEEPASGAVVLLRRAAGPNEQEIGRAAGVRILNAEGLGAWLLGLAPTPAAPIVVGEAAEASASAPAVRRAPPAPPAEGAPGV